jgi:hypothetical protein
MADAFHVVYPSWPVYELSDTPPAQAIAHPTSADKAAFATRRAAFETGYSAQQSTKPQTLGYGLVGSLVAQRAIALTYWNALPRSGHFALLEQPALLFDSCARRSGRCRPTSSKPYRKLAHGKAVLRPDRSPPP